MKTFLQLLFVVGFGLLSLPAQAQITGSKIKSPTLNTGVTSPVGLPDSFDEVLNGLRNGQCYSLALTSLQLVPVNSTKKDHKVETRHGVSELKADGKNLITTINLQAGLNENGSRRVLNTTIKLRKSSSGLVLDIRNASYYHLIYELTLVKKKNGYYLIAERDENGLTVSFTLAIFKTVCLI